MLLAPRAPRAPRFLSSVLVFFYLDRYLSKLARNPNRAPGVIVAAVVVVTVGLSPLAPPLRCDGPCDCMF